MIKLKCDCGYVVETNGAHTKEGDWFVCPNCRMAFKCSTHIVPDDTPLGYDAERQRIEEDDALLTKITKKCRENPQFARRAIDAALFGIANLIGGMPFTREEGAVILRDDTDVSK